MAGCNVENNVQPHSNGFYVSSFQDAEELPLDASCSSIEEFLWFKELKSYERRMPPDIKVGYYDAIIVYSDDNQDEAQRFCEHLRTDIQLEGVKVVLYDCDELMSLARSKIRLLELALERCIYVFLFMTSEFCEDAEMKLCREEYLMKTMQDEKQQWRLVPVYTMPCDSLHRNFRIPFGFNSLIGLNYFKNDIYYRQKVKKLLEDGLHLRQENERSHLVKQYEWLQEQKGRPISYVYNSDNVAGRIDSVPHKRTDDSKDLVFVSQILSSTEIEDDRDNKICIIKQFVYVKSEMSKESGREIAKRFVAKKYMSQKEYDKIIDSRCLRGRLIDLLLKKVILGESGEVKTFLQGLKNEHPDLAKTLEETEVTYEDKSKFAEVEKKSHGERSMFALLFGGCDVDDQDIVFFEHMLCVSPRVIEDINDAMLSRFYFTVKDHEDVVQCKKNDERIKMLFRKIQICSFDVEFELQNLLPPRLWRKWKEKRKNKGRLTRLRQWINTSRTFVTSIFENMILVIAEDGSIILKFLTEDNFNIELLSKESIERKIKDLVEKGFLEIEKPPVSLICVTVFIKSSDITGPEEIHIYLDFDATDGILTENDYDQADKSNRAKTLMAEEMDPARLFKWIDRNPGLDAYQKMLLEDAISEENTCRRQKMETILGILDGLEKGQELLAKYCKENDPYVYSEVYEKLKEPISHVDPAVERNPVLAYEKGGGLQKLYSFQISFGTDIKDLKEMSPINDISHCHEGKQHQFEQDKVAIPEQPKAEDHCYIRETLVLSTGSSVISVSKENEKQDLKDRSPINDTSYCHEDKQHQFEQEKYEIPEQPKAEALYCIRNTCVLSPRYSCSFIDLSKIKENQEIDGDLEGVVCLIKQYAYIKSNLSMAQLPIIAMKLQQEGLIHFSDFEAIAERALPGDFFVNKFYSRRHRIDVVLKTVIGRRSEVLNLFLETLKSGSPEIARKVAKTEVTQKDHIRFARLKDYVYEEMALSWRSHRESRDVFRNDKCLLRFPEVDVLADVLLSHFHISVKDHSRIVNSHYEPSKRKRKILLDTMHLRDSIFDMYLECPECINHMKKISKIEIAEHREGIICILKQYVNIMSNLSYQQAQEIAHELLHLECIGWKEFTDIMDSSMQAVDVLLKTVIRGPQGILMAFYETLKSLSPKIAKMVAETEITHEDLSRFAHLEDTALHDIPDAKCRNLGLFHHHLSAKDVDEIDRLADEMLSHLSISILDHNKIKRCNNIDDKIKVLVTLMQLRNIDPDTELSNSLNPSLYNKLQTVGEPGIKSEAWKGVAEAFRYAFNMPFGVFRRFKEQT